MLSRTPLPAQFFNNIGVLHFQLGSARLGSFYLARALDLSLSLYHTSGAMPLTRPSLSTFTSDCRPQLLYNNGLSRLWNGHPDTAFWCLQGAAALYTQDARVWLRLGECCVALHKASTQQQQQRRGLGTASAPSQPSLSSSSSSDSTAGAGHHHHHHQQHHPHHQQAGPSLEPEVLVVLPRGAPSGLPLDEAQARPRTKVFQQPPFGCASLEYAAKALRNCLAACNKQSPSQQRKLHILLTDVGESYRSFGVM